MKEAPNYTNAFWVFMCINMFIFIMIVKAIAGWIGVCLVFLLFNTLMDNVINSGHSGDN